MVRHLKLVTPEVRVPYRIYRDPLPKPRRGREPKYPFAQMQVGDCFYVPVSEVKSASNLQAVARVWAKRNGKAWNFATRLAGTRIGIWRVA